MRNFTILLNIRNQNPLLNKPFMTSDRSYYNKHLEHTHTKINGNNYRTLLFKDLNATDIIFIFTDIIIHAKVFSVKVTASFCRICGVVFPARRSLSRCRGMG